MIVDLKKIYDCDGTPVPFARLDIYEVGPNGRRLATVNADETGLLPAVEIDAEAVRLEAWTETVMLSSYDDLAAPNGQLGMEK